MPLFIIGMPRSGTTLLSMILNAHSELAIPPETHYFSKHYWRCPSNKAFLDQGKYWNYVQSLVESEEVQDLGFSAEETGELLTLLDSLQAPSHGEILGTILTRYAQKQGKRIWGEKTPRHGLDIQLIHREFENAKFVSIVRDPRDVSLSWARVSWGYGNEFCHALRWRKYTHLTDTYLEDPAIDLMEIRYEDLITDTEKVVREICTYIGIEFDASMLEYPSYEQRTFDPIKEPWKVKSLNPIDPNNLSKWKEVLGRPERCIIEALARKGMHTRGYELTHSFANLSLKDMLIAALHVMLGLVEEARLSLKRVSLRVRRIMTRLADRRGFLRAKC